MIKSNEKVTKKRMINLTFQVKKLSNIEKKIEIQLKIYN